MSNVKIKANASGTADFTIQAPATDSALTLTLPSVDGELLTVDGDGSQLTGVGGGITHANQWALTANTGTITSDTTLTGFSEFATAPYGKIGTGMSHSSGVFTFPATGIWQVNFSFRTQQTGTGGSSNEYAYGGVQATTNNGSTWTSMAFNSNSGLDGNDWAGAQVSTIVDVTDTANVKVRFQVGSQDGVAFVGATNSFNTGALFVRLGDT